MDMWAAGCIMASLIFKKDPFIRGKDDHHQLLKIVEVLGADEYFDYINKYNIEPPEEIQERINED